MSEKFNLFMSQLSDTNATLGYFTDFYKIKSNVGKISIKLNQLNYLLGKEDLLSAVEELFEENSKVFDVLGILIAVRDTKSTKIIDEQGKFFSLDSYFSSPKDVYFFIEKTGLANVFKNKEITNLVDYVFGIEVGLDTNARKNRGGTNMANAISRLFDNAGIFYKKEVGNTFFPEITTFGEDLKRFDFVVKTCYKVYLIEVNYYNTGGSKLNEVARSYSIVAPKINQFSSYEFVWITDGKGWFDAKNKLQEAFSVIPNIYNLTTLPDFISQVKAEGVLTF